MKFLAISPTNETLVLECLDGATAFDARNYAARAFGVAPQALTTLRRPLLVTETGEDAREDVRLRYVGNAAGTPNTRRLEVQARGKGGKWGEWKEDKP